MTLPRDQGNVSVAGVLSVEEVATFDTTEIVNGILTVTTRDAPDVDRTFVTADGRLTVVEGVGVAIRTVDVGGPELVTNGQFPIDIAGWTDGSSAGGTISYSSGRLRTTNTSGTARARQSVTVDNGERYAFFAQNPAGTVNGSVALGSTTPGSNDYLGTNTNAAIAARAGVREYTAVSTTTQIQLSTGTAGNDDWDNVTLRKLIGTEFPAGTIFEDDFSIKSDGPLGVTPDGLIWREMTPQSASHVYPYIAGGKMAVTANGSGDTASYPYLDMGDGKVASLHCDIEWSGAGSVAMVSLEPSGTLPTVANILANSLHIVFTDTKVDITTYVASAVTTETVNYAAPVELDGRTYEGVGWSLSGSTLTITLPDGTEVVRTDSKFAQVQGSHAIPEIYYTGAAVGPVTLSKVAVRLG